MLSNSIGFYVLLYGLFLHPFFMIRNQMFRANQHNHNKTWPANRLLCSIENNNLCKTSITISWYIYIYCIYRLHWVAQYKVLKPTEIWTWLAEQKVRIRCCLDMDLVKCDQMCVLIMVRHASLFIIST